MADSNVNRSSRSEQSSANARDAPESSSTPSKIDQSPDEIITSRKGKGQVSVAQKKREAEGPVDGAIVVQKKPAVQAPENAAASGFSRSLMVATEKEDDLGFKRELFRKLIGLNPDIKYSISESGYDQATPEEKFMVNHLTSMWKQKNGGYIPPSLITVTRLRHGTSRQRFMQEDPGDEDRVHEAGQQQQQQQQQQQPKALTGPAPPADKKKKKKTKGQRRRAREEREELERQAAQATASGRVQDVEMENGPESEGGNGLAGQNPPSQKEFTFQTPAGAPSFPPASVCGNCNKQGHVLSACPGPVDKDGFVSGCVLHNTKKHSCDECYLLQTLSIGVHFELLVEGRSGLPPIRSQESSWVDLATHFQHRRLNTYPLTRSFSLKISEEAIASYDFSGDASVFQLGSDPLTCSFDALILHSERLSKTESPAAPLEVEEEDRQDTPMINHGDNYDDNEVDFGDLTLDDIVEHLVD
ncbi:hypothetical protein GL218_06429 [Daldinia childiae]|uniref:uncharacterized protein n=1 Tax=Daldinia childiae TaxID=326645 RepID=UPI001444AE94|nr:uncharacterized protein GL218_06429 [Daldinia childiae]KAF3056361.1 hypothetical protein GL218_06429 [Daldinia childiae]